MYNYISLFASSGNRNVRNAPSLTNSSVMRTIKSPCRVQIASDSSNRDDFLLFVQYNRRDTEFEYWIELKNGGYIRYLEADENGGFHDVIGIIEQSETVLSTSGTSTISTSSMQTATNAADDAVTETMEEMEEGTLQSNEGYFVPVDEILNYQNDNWTTDTQGSEFYNIGSVLGIQGLPYQFMPHVDTRLDGTSQIASVGADYASKIIAEMPLLMITPGVPNFAKGYSDEEKKDIISSLIGTASDLVTGNLNDLLSRTGRYYTFQPKITDYFNYLNPMARICARLMEVQDKTVEFDGSMQKLDNVNWMNYTQKKLSSIIDLATDYMAIPFYIDSETQINESFSNDVTDSSLASTINSISDLTKELTFLLGYGGSIVDIDGLVSGDTLQNSENLTELLNNLTNKAGGFGWLNSLTKQIGSVATGGRLIFPKIWSDSSFTRSYDINIKLRSPDMDNFSLFLNIILPLCFLICLTQPRMVTNNPNAYASPFLVRAVYKGFFNVDMGIITSLSFTKGDEAQWNNMGIPTTVDVSMTITDLYSAMSITPTSMGNLSYDTLDNTALMDYLMTMCGINVYKPEISRAIDMWLVNNFYNRASDLFSTSLWGNIRQSVSNAILNLYRRG